MKNSGFTLIELSVVLVIIGLVVGGILTGQELIHAAGIRATSGQLEKYNTATNTFRLKYGYLPGDIPHTQAQAFGLYYSTWLDGNGIYINGNGDGILEAQISSLWPQAFSGEVAMFFLQLSQAGLIDGMYGAGGADAIVGGATATGGSGNAESTATVYGAQVNELIPPAKLGNGNSFIALSDNVTNYFVLSGITEILGGWDGTGFFATNNLTPNDAYVIDKKIDDGLPGTGTVFALDAVTNYLYEAPNSPTGVTTPSANNCVNGGKYYISDSVHANLQNCSLRFNFQ
jgi:prepilin-type N-terminal cleavage/methylation domain-containing protein